ncbi:structural maintenance of chromosomes protein 4 [Monosporozyma servazzii]
MDSDQPPQSKKLRTEVTPIPIVPPPTEVNQIPADPEFTTPNGSRTENEKTPAFKLSQPRKLVIGSPEHRYAFSQPTVMPSNEKLPSGRVPSLSGGPLLLSSQNIGQTERGRRMKTYTQSPPKSPNRSPTRTLELIKLSPTKKSRMELQKLYDAQQAKVSKKERLFIHQLVMNNFKSYAGSQVIGPFDPSFSAVVGPNGSGKSNVIDSMLFVFGFRANKMRQDRLSDLIHKSEEFPNLSSCSVEVHFRYATDKEGKETEIIPDKELIVERRAFKNNSSKYYINGKESNYTEVTQMLRQEGIDLDHKRFLILQGEVENIAQMKSKAEKGSDDGLLEYLEDIIGTAKYKPLIETNLVKADELNDICIEKKNRYDFVTKEKTSLEADKDKALEFIKKEKQFTIEKATLTQYELYQNNKKIQSTLTKLSDLNEDLDKKKDDNNRLLESKKTTETEINTLKKKLSDLDKEIKDLTKKKRELNTVKVSTEEITKNAIRKKKITENTIEKSKSSIRETENKLQELEKLQDEYDTELTELRGNLETEKTLLNEIKLSLKDKTESFSKEISELEKDLEPWNIEIQKKKSDIKLTEMDINLLNEGKEKSESHVKMIENTLKQLTTSLIEKEKKILDIEKQHKSITKEIAFGEEECTNAKNKILEMASIINSQRQQTEDARSTLSTHENRSRILTELTKLQKSGKISGFHGRLGDLGIIDDKYDVAVSTACPRLNDIVVETVECGQYCLEFIKKNRLGFTRFILLDKINNNINRINTPEHTPRLFDLVTPKQPKFAAAFFNVMGNTLVANDLKQANRVAYGKKRFRVVTLDGKLIDISGTMTGGGNNVSSNLLQLKSKTSHHTETFTETEVLKMEAALEEKEKSYHIARDTLHEMELELSKLKDQEPQLEMEGAKLKIDIEAIKNEFKVKEVDLQNKIHERESVANDTKQSDALSLKLAALKEELREIMDQCKSTTQNIEQLKDKIMKIGGTKLQMQNSKVNSILERIGILESKGKKDKHTIKKAKSSLKRLNKTLEASVEESDQINIDLKKAEEVTKESTSKLQEIETILNAYESQVNEQNSIIEEKAQELQDLEVELNDFKSYELESKNKLEKLNGLLNTLKRTASQLSNELSNYRLREISTIIEQIEEQSDKEECTNNDEKATPQSNESNHSNGNAQDTDVASTPDESAMDIDQKDSEITNGIPRLSEHLLENLNVSVQVRKIEDLQAYVDTANVNVEVLEEYARRLIEHKNRERDLNNALKDRDQITKELEELKKKRFDEFMEGFGIISMTLKEMYQMITMGGNAELELVDSLDPFSEGVTFSVMPPKKSWRNISNLSGGEKTLSSLALVFALHKYKPTPLYVMDEIDAALDFRNVSIVANYITERTKNAQFVVISLRNNMFELAKNLVGIYKFENMSKSATLKNKDHNGV